jgi:uncharacterized protein (TIGR03437 family)
MRRILRFVPIGVAVLSAFVASGSLKATCSTFVHYNVTGDFGKDPVSGPDTLKLGGGPFTVDLLACVTLVPTQTGSDYAVYTPVRLTGTVKSALLTTPYTIKPTTTSIMLVVPPTGTDLLQLGGPVVVAGGTINIHGSIAVPAGTITSTALATFPSSTVVTASSGFSYSQNSQTTVLSVIGTAIATIYTTPPAAQPMLHTGAMQVITSNADGSQTVRALGAAPLELGVAPGKVMLQFYASGVRDASNVEVRIAGQSVPVIYSGAAGHFPGLDEVTVEVPRSLAGIDEADVELTVDGRPASPVRIHIQ